MGLGSGGPDARSGLAVFLAEQPVRLSGKFPGAAVMLCSLVQSLGLRSSGRPCSGSDTPTLPRDLPYGACRHGDRAGNRGGGQEREPDPGTDVSAAAAPPNP